MPHFRAFSAEELAFVSKFKRGELVAETGATILAEGSHSAQLFTLLSGWAFRFKTLPDGRRQILNYCLPGDLIGLQGSVIGAMEHSVEALSPVVLCVFQRDGLGDLYRRQPGLSFDVTWLARSACWTSTC
jgi:CRP-like cAMP-binding protein